MVPRGRWAPHQPRASPAVLAIPDSAWGFDDHLGWHEQIMLLDVGIFISNGRICDKNRDGIPMWTTLRGIVEKFARRFA